MRVGCVDPARPQDGCESESVRGGSGTRGGGEGERAEGFHRADGDAVRGAREREPGAEAAIPGGVPRAVWAPAGGGA